ncbi:hypothetical protein [Methylocystis sp. ATCC 49242]|nr:hypothetical protein [Methylocystis sp. ATCC 49242]
MVELFSGVSLEIAGAVLAATFFVAECVKQESAAALRIATARKRAPR